MKKIMIILNAIVNNRGSEALVRGLSKIIKVEYADDVYITLASSEDEFDNRVNIDEIDKYTKKYNFDSKSFCKYFSKILLKLKLYNLETKYRYSKLLSEAKKQDLVIIVGADNYDITYNMQNKLYSLHTYLKNNGIKMFLFDCSIDERDITETLKKDIENFLAINVRETISLENIKNLNNKVYLYPDSAFAMMPEKVELPKVFEKGKVVGINASNLITREKYSNNSQVVIQSYVELIKFILNNTDYSVVLIPHVMHNADLGTLKIIYKDFINNDRVYLVEDESLNARQLKYIISNCHLYVGARTHSTIAAYSSKVPTLVLGYSVKSKGIAKDLFGTYENYVLPVSNIDNDQYLVNGFKWLMLNESSIREKLNNCIDKYIDDAKSIIKLIDKLLK